MNLRSFLSEELWLFLLLAVLLGLAVPGAGRHITPYSIYFLLVVMFLTSLGIELADIRGALTHVRHLLTALLLVFVLSPLVAFLLSFTLEKKLAVGLILYSAIPSAMANAFYIRRLRKNAALALLITVFTTLMAPFITPLVVKLLTGVFLDMNPFDLFLSLIKLILLPFGLAGLIRHYAKGAAQILLSNSAPITTVCMFFVILGVISSASDKVWEMGWLALITLIYIVITFFMGFLAAGEERMVMAFGNGFRNGTLAMVVALEVFGPSAALVGVITTIMHNMALVPVMFWSRGKS